MERAPIPPRASPSCARGSGAAPSDRSSAPPYRIAPGWFSGPADTHPRPSLLLAAWAATSSAASTRRAMAPTPPRASPSCARGSGAAPSDRSSAPPPPKRPLSC
eukprot:scaffold48896_cov49-Phaeocystis_antarctica.AAC.2